MKPKLLLVLAACGFVVPNGIFLHQAIMNPAAVRAALANPLSLVFIAEAVFLMVLFASLIHRQGVRSPGWLAFIVASLVGSLAFSVPLFLYLSNRKQGET